MNNYNVVLGDHIFMFWWCQDLEELHNYVYKLRVWIYWLNAKIAIIVNIKY